MMKWFWTFFAVLFIYNFVYDTVLLFRTKPSECAEDNTNSMASSPPKKRVLDIVILAFAALLTLLFDKNSMIFPSPISAFKAMIELSECFHL